MYSIEVERDEDDEGHGKREASSSSYSSSSATSFIQKGECHRRKAAGVKPKPRKQLKLSKYAKEGSSYRGGRERRTRKRRTRGDDDDDDDDGEGQVGENAKVVKFLKSPEGIIPSLCRTLTEHRKQVKREMKNLPKDDAYARGILNSKQLALKLTSNSLYGSMGFSKGLLFHSDAAQAVTAKGSKLIHSMRDMIVDRYGGREIYGDTDSTMVVVSKKHAWDQASCVALGNTIEKWINGEASPDRPQLGSNITVEFEKAMTMRAIKKTKYCAYFYDPTCATKYLQEKGGDSDDPSGSTPALYHRGTILKRRDSVEVARKMYEKVVRMALSGRSKTDVLLQVSLEVQEEFNTDDYSTFVSTMKVNYEGVSGTSIGKTFLDMMDKKGQRIQPYSRFEYLITKRKKSSSSQRKANLGLRMTLVSDYLQDPELELDKRYYIDHKIKNNLDDLCETICGHSENMQVTVGTRKVSLYRPVECFIVIGEVVNMENAHSVYAKMLSKKRSFQASPFRPSDPCDGAINPRTWTRVDG